MKLLEGARNGVLEESEHDAIVLTNLRDEITKLETLLDNQ